MNGIESAQFDLTEAQASVDTAIHLLSSIVSDGQQRPSNDLYALINRLRGIHEELSHDISALDNLHDS